MALLAAKVLLAPLCVVGVSLAGRRWGMGVAGVLGGLPVVAGPILLAITLIHGRSFGAESAAGTLLALAALTAFVVVYGRVAQRSGPLASVLGGWTVFVIGIALLSLISPPPGVSLLFVGACFVTGIVLLPSPCSPLPPPPSPPRWDLPARALGALTLVLVITALSGALGAKLSGLLAPFPIITSVLAVFTHAHGGVPQLELLLRNFLFGFYGFATFCFVLAIALPSLPTAPAFGLALVVALLTQATSSLLRFRLAPAIGI